MYYQANECADLLWFFFQVHVLSNFFHYLPEHVDRLSKLLLRMLRDDQIEVDCFFPRGRGCMVLLPFFFLGWVVVWLL